MRERDAVGMQKHPLQSLFRQRLVAREVAVLVVTDDRKAEVRKMHAYLMRTPGLELSFNQ